MTPLPSSTGRRSRPLLLLALIWVFPLAIWGIGFTLSSIVHDRALSPSLDTTIVAGSRDVELRQGVDVRVRLGAPRQLRLDDSGIVTKVAVAKGGELANGTVVLEVEGVPRVAYSAEVPFYRNLEIGDEGSDVLALSRLLQTTGHLEAEETYTEFGWRLSSALAGFQEERGLLNDGKLRVNEFLFLPDDFGRVIDVSAVVGFPVPSDGVIATGMGLPDSLEISTAGTGEAPEGYETAAVLVIEAGDRSAPLPSLSPDPESVLGLVAELEAWENDGIVHGALEESSLSYTGLFIALGEPLRVATVPNSAVLAGADGATCVIVQEADGSSRVVGVSAVPLTGELGVSGVDAALAGKTLLRDAALSSEARTCR